jgi:hypothetical protein
MTVSRNPWANKCIKFRLIEGRPDRNGNPRVEGCFNPLPCEAKHGELLPNPERILTEEEWLEQEAARLLEKYGPDFEGFERIDMGCNCAGRAALPNVKVETHRCGCVMRATAHQRAGIPYYRAKREGDME